MKRLRVRLKSSKINKPVLDSSSEAEKSKNELVTNQDHKWTEEETLALCAAVEVRPVLWAAEFRNYEQGAKDRAWEEISSELNHISPKQLKKKWTLLRRNLRCSIKKDGGSKWAEYMPFLAKEKLNEARQAKSAEIEITDDSEIDFYQPRGRPCMPAEVAVGNVSSSTPCVSTTETSDAGLQIPDPISTFCDYVLAELNMLSAAESRQLRKELMHVVYNFESL